MDKLFILIGERNQTDVTVLASWTKMPTQDTVDKLIRDYTSDYERFALMQDILFIPGTYDGFFHIG